MNELTELINTRHIREMIVEQATKITILRDGDGSLVNSCMTSSAIERIKPKLVEEGEVVIVSLNLFAAIRYNGYIYTLSFPNKPKT